MKTYIKFLFVLFVIPMILTTGCKEESVDGYEVLTQYMKDNSLDLPDVLNGWITDASAVVNEADGTVPDYYVLDIRSAADFSTGHIKGAVNTSLSDILTAAANAGGKNILVVCYTGQTAAHGVVALRLSGYPDAKVLKWGMAGWHSDFAGKWLANSGMENGKKAVGNANWEYPMNVAADSEYQFPVFETNATTGAEILKERVALLTEFKGVTNTDVLANPEGFFINNYWAETDTEHYGHIKGAHRINVLTLAGGEFNKLNPDEIIVTYCWTGQTSSMVTAYLTVLGYDAKSLMFGTNGMIYPNLESHKYSAPAGGYLFE